jgi:hypothetical protein
MSYKNNQTEEDNCQGYYYRILGTMAFAVGVTYLLNIDAPFPKGALGKSSTEYLDYTE